ncbi:helix-turn-helix domain-containing protein [Macrococcoides caseolyticum]|nr:helix-turn-helix transcriptional regulator [Macrococcus caseolyticus]
MKRKIYNELVDKKTTRRIFMCVGARIKKLRIKRNVSADDLAKAVGVSRATIFRYENGDIEKMPATTLEKIAKYLFTTPAYLMGWEEDNSNSNDHNEIAETIAAHIDDDATEEEIEEILAYIEMRRNLRNNRNK